MLVEALRNDIAVQDDANLAPDAPEYVVLRDIGLVDDPHNSDSSWDRLVVTFVQLGFSPHSHSSWRTEPGVEPAPPLAREASFLVCADYANYDLALQRICQSLEFFERKPLFEFVPPARADSVKVQVVLPPTNIESANLLFSSLGVRMRPALLYQATFRAAGN